jgi:hypothetical protein
VLCLVETGAELGSRVGCIVELQSGITDMEHKTDTIDLAVNGTLMRGLELNQNLLSVGATFVREDFTAPVYRIWSIGDVHPAMMRVGTGGVSIALEIWAVPLNGLSAILLQEPSGLCIGKIKLRSGLETLGVLGEAILCEGQREITRFGGWRAYLTAKASQRNAIES